MVRQTKVVFVHGISVREVDYESSFCEVTKALDEHCDAATVRCLWGDEFGAILGASGSAIPDYEQTRGAQTKDPLNEVDESTALWDHLYDFPLFELEFLAMRPNATKVVFSPGKQPLLDHFIAKLQRLHDQQEDDVLNAMLRASVEPESLRSAITELISHGHMRATLESALSASADDQAEFVLATARTLVALMREYQLSAASENMNAIESYFPAVAKPLVSNAFARDNLVRSIANAISPLQEKSIIGRWIKSAALALATNHVRSRRGRYTRAIVPYVGDVLTYQAHGGGIRSKIIESLSSAVTDDPDCALVLLGHSLGGVACVDLLALNEHWRSRVHMLVTVGSQAPVLFEMNALQGCPNRRSLPQGFPVWLNIYDRRDFLSYVAEKVFSGRGPKKVIDVPVDNEQPFPESHTAYWANPQTWRAIAEHRHKLGLQS